MRATKLLAAALQDHDMNLRIAAAEALNNNADPCAVNSLVEALLDPDLRVYAAGALAKIGAPAVLQLINAIADTSGGTDSFQADLGIANNFHLVDVLVKIGEPAVETLILALKDRNEEVRKAAAEALKEIRDPRCVEPFIEALQDEIGLVRAIAADVVWS